MKNIKALSGNVFIKLKSTKNDRTESGLYKDVTFDVHGKMMIYGEAISVSEEGSNEVMLHIDGGVPKPRGDKGELTNTNYVRNYEVEHNIRVGDKVYFHYLTLEDPLNYIYYDGEYYIYKVPIHDIFLSARPDLYGDYIVKGEKTKVFLHNQYVLGTEYWGDGWEEIEMEDPKTGKITTIAGKTNSFGMVTETKDEPMKDEAIITDIGRGIDPYSRYKEVKAGDAVLITPNSEFKNEIERQERWVFTHQDILAIKDKKAEGGVRPVADMVLIYLKKREYLGDMVVDKTKLNLNNEGRIVSIGGSVDSELMTAGVQVKFSSHGSRVINDEYALVHYCNILGVLNYSI